MADQSRHPRFAKMSLFALVLSCSLALFGPLRAQSLSPPTAQLVEDPSGRGGRVRAQILIPVEATLVWDVMVDCAGAPRFVPNLRSCETVSVASDGLSDVRQHRIAWLAGFPPVTIRFASRYQPNREIRFERISGDIAQMSGIWRLEPSRDGRSTLLSYEAHLVPSRFMPSALVRPALLRDTPKILEAVRQEAVRRRASMR